MNFDANTVAQSYLNLGHPDAKIQSNANQYLMEFRESPQAWQISKELLIDQTNEKLQFLGSQVLYLKIQKEFHELDDDEKNAMREFIFGTIFSNEKLSNNSIKQLCAGASMIGVQMILNQWQNFVNDLLELAKGSPQKAWAILEILTLLPRELKEITFGNEYKQQVTAALKNSGNTLLEFLFHVISETTADDRLVEKGLECLKTLTQMHLMELLDFPFLIDVLIKKIDHPTSGGFAIDALVESVKMSNYPDKLLEADIAGTTYTPPENVQESIKKLLELIQQIKSVYDKISYSPLCYQFSELTSHLAINFHLIFIKDIPTCKDIFELLLLSVSHENRKISHESFSYWNFLRGEMKTSEDILRLVKAPEYSFIADAYAKLFEIVGNHCKAKSLKLVSAEETISRTINNVSSEEREFFEEDEDSDFTLQDYRYFSKDVLYSCCSVVSMLKGGEGLEAFFNLIIPYLREDYLVQNNINLEDEKVRREYILECELRIFLARPILDYLNHKIALIQTLDLPPDSQHAFPDGVNYEIFSQYIIEIINQILKFPREWILVRTSLYFIKEAFDIIRKWVPESTNLLLEYCLDVSDRSLIETVSQCLATLTKMGTDQINKTNLERLANWMKNSIFFVEDKGNNLGCFSAIFRLAKYIPDDHMMIQFIQNIFTSVEEQFKLFSSTVNQSTIKHSATQADAKKLFVTFSNMLRGFKIENSENNVKSKTIAEEVVVPFICRNINYICGYLEVYHSEEEFVGFFQNIIQNSIKICGVNLNQFYTQVLVSTLTAFEANPSQNAALLDILSTLLFYFEHSEQQQQWLEHNFSNFNNFLINQIRIEKNAFILSKWIDILKKVFGLYRDFFLSLPELEDLIKFGLEVFNEHLTPDMLKRVADFINCFIGTSMTIQHPTVEKYIPTILEVTFAKLPQIGSHKVNILSTIVFNILTEIQRGDLIIELFLNALNQPAYEKISNEQKKIFLECVYGYRNSQKDLTLVMKDFGEFAQDPEAKYESMQNVMASYQKLQ